MEFLDSLSYLQFKGKQDLSKTYDADMNCYNPNLSIMMKKEVFCSYYTQSIEDKNCDKFEHSHIKSMNFISQALDYQSFQSLHSHCTNLTIDYFK